MAGIGGMVVSGKPQTFSIVSRIAFDRSGMRLYAFSNLTNIRNVNLVKVIQDYKSGYQWAIDVESQQCKKTKLTQKYNDGCIPDDAKYNGNYLIGLGDESLMGQSFSFDAKPLPGTNLNPIVTLTTEQCVPVGEILVGTYNDHPMMLDLGYVNVTAGIMDQSIFNPPSFCKHNNTDIFAPHTEAFHQIIAF